LDILSIHSALPIKNKIKIKITYRFGKNQLDVTRKGSETIGELEGGGF